MPLSPPASFEWCECDVSDAREVQEVYELLSLNSVEDDDAMFRWGHGTCKGAPALNRVVAQGVANACCGGMGVFVPRGWSPPGPSLPLPLPLPPAPGSTTLLSSCSGRCSRPATGRSGTRACA